MDHHYSDEEGFGPIDSFLMKPLYAGKTREGIGLGSSAEAVTETYGEPIKIRTTYLKVSRSQITTTCTASRTSC